MKLFRTLLFVPGSKPEWIAKSADYGADAVILDLEDSVPSRLKAEARSHVAASIPALQKKGQRVYVRINHDGGPDEEDLKAVVLPELEGLVIPKLYGPEDVQKIHACLTQAERKNGVEPGSVALIPTLETARSVMQAYEIACCERVVAIVAINAKNGDAARAIGYQWTPEGLETLYIRSKVVLAARAAGVHPLVGVWQDVHDLDGLRKSAQFQRQLGFDGELLLHPSNVPVVNRIYGLTEEQIRYYEQMIEAYEIAAREGKGAVLYQGEHIDLAHVQTARRMLELYKS